MSDGCLDESLWFEKPSALLEPEKLKRFVFLPNMTYNQRHNAIVRFVLYLTIIGYVLTQKIGFVYLFIAVLGYLFYAHHRQKQQLANVLGATQIGGGIPEGIPSSELSSSELPSSELPSFGVSSETPSPCQSLEEDENVSDDAVVRNNLISQDVVIEPVTNQICRLSTPNNPFGNAMPGATLDNNFAFCDPAIQKTEIENNFNKNLFLDLNDVWQRNNQQRQYVTKPSTTIPNDRESFSKYLWDTVYVCRDGDLDACFKQGY